MKINKLFLFALFALFAACGGSDDEELIGDWHFIGNFGGDPRQDAVSFVVKNKAYVGLGYNAKYFALKDFKVFDGEAFTDLAAEFPGEARHGATSFAIGNKAYVGLGYDQKNKKYFGDFWEFDADKNSWRIVDSFPKDARGRVERRNAVGGAVGGKGYVIGGYDGANSYMDVYEYTPDANGTGLGSWAKKPEQQYKGSKRRSASTFVIDDKLYLFGGSNNSNAMAYDFQVFDPKVGTWKTLNQVRNALKNESFDDEYGQLAREEACAFTMNGKAYVTLGKTGSYNSTTYEYDPSVDRWYKKTAFEARSGRTLGIGFSLMVKDKLGNTIEQGFVSGGVSGGEYPDDIWEFFPNVERDDYNNN